MRELSQTLMTPLPIMSKEGQEMRKVRCAMLKMNARISLLLSMPFSRMIPVAYND